MDRYNELIGRRDEHKNIVYEYRLSIKNIERQIQEIEHKIEIIRGNIFQLKKEKSRLEQEIVELTNSKICPSCGQPKTKEHIGHVNEVIVKNNEINDILEKIVVFENNDIGIHNNTITEYRNKIVTINKSIDDSNIQMENVLSEIGKLTNDKNDVEKYKLLKLEVSLLPDKIQNEELKISLLEQKIIAYQNSLNQIEMNKVIEGKLSQA